MKIHDQLDEIFSRGSKVKVLRYLFREDDDQTGRGIARAVGMSPSMAHSVLSELSAEGLVDVRKKGKAKLYRLRSGSHVLEKLIKPLFEGEQDLFRELIKDLNSGILSSEQEIVNISIFGSVAAKNETAQSDLDLLVVVGTGSGKKAIQSSIDKLSIGLAEKYGIALSPYVVTGGELKKIRDRKLPLVKSILSNNHLIYGEPLERILA
jgi:predicted nucleotidyltransferase/predicted transcriptional regulator